MASRAHPPPVQLGTDTLYEVIGAIAKGPDLDRVLAAVVELLTRATACHACFVYLLEGEQLRMRAASEIFRSSVGRVALGLDEGLCGWVARNRQPSFIRERAFEDPRMKHIPELQEERFQSMVAVPLLDRSEACTGVVVLHTEAPREFGQDVLDFLVHVASLVAGAIDNARLYDSSRRQVRALSALAGLAQEIAAAPDRAALYSTTREGVRRLLPATDAALRTAEDEHPFPDPVPGSGHHISAPVAAGEVSLGLLVARRPPDSAAFGDDERQLLDSVAHQLAVAMQKLELVERLTEETLARSLFDALDADRLTSAETLAQRAGLDLHHEHALLRLSASRDGEPASRAMSERVERRLRQLIPGVLCDAGDDGLLAIVRVVQPPRGLDALDAQLARIGREERVVLGRGDAHAGAGGARRSLAEARVAARVAAALEPGGGGRSYGGLGAYRFLTPPNEHVPDPRLTRAIATLQAYDERRRAELVVTLERFLAHRGRLAPAARALPVHVNTLRQRLSRIEELTGLSLADEDLLSLELALMHARIGSV